MIMMIEDILDEQKWMDCVLAKIDWNEDVGQRREG